VEGYFHGVSVMGDDLRDRVYSAAFRKRLNGYRAVEVLRRHHAHSPVRDGDAVSQVQYLDMKTYMVGDILTKVDRASMAHALEVRVPFLDHQLMEWVSGLPVGYKLKGAEGKYMLKKALEPHLPHDIMYRRKMGFSIPLAEWFRGPLKDRLYAALTSQRMADTGLFDMAFLKRMADDHARGVRDYSASLWSLYMFEAFLRQQESPGSAT
jgi:asparagine synthase (glutamine-hydrolysing)